MVSVLPGGCPLCVCPHMKDSGQAHCAAIEEVVLKLIPLARSHHELQSALPAGFAGTVAPVPRALAFYTANWWLLIISDLLYLAVRL